jgi:Tfp pilus assembly protein FimT
MDKNCARGFSLVEALILVAVMMIISAVGIVGIRASMNIVDADRAIQLVASQLRYARQVAVDQRRLVLVEFLGTNQIKLTRQDGGGATTVLSDVTLPSGFTYAMPDDVIDTPDGYGNDAPVYFNVETSGTFLADGIFVNGAGIVTNGTVFTMGPSGNTARAATLTGASGRSRIYRFDGAAWTE